MHTQVLAGVDGTLAALDGTPPPTCDGCEDSCVQGQCVPSCPAPDDPNSHFGCPTGTFAKADDEDCFCVVPTPVAGHVNGPEGAGPTGSIGGTIESGGTFIPSDRTGARGLLSATERAVYLVGGRRGSRPTGEIWRYNLDTREWLHVFALPPRTSTAKGEVRVGDVQALGYDADAGKMVVLDNLTFDPSTLFPRAPVTGRTPPPGKPPVIDESGVQRLLDQIQRHRKDGVGLLSLLKELGDKIHAELQDNDPRRYDKILQLVKKAHLDQIQTARLIVFDTRSGMSNVAVEMPVTGLFTKVGLAARGDGTFVLVGTQFDRNKWIAFDFKVTPSNGITWRGTTEGRGHVLYDPFVYKRDTLLPVEDNKIIKMLSLAPKLFHAAKCESL